MSDTCHDFHQLMTDALDGRLGAADRARFERLIAQSEDRRREWEAYREMRDTLLAIGTESAPAELARTIGGAVRADEDSSASGPAPVSAWSHLRTMGWARAAAVMAAFISVAAILNTESDVGDAVGVQSPESQEVADVELDKNAKTQFETVDGPRAAARLLIKPGLLNEADMLRGFDLGKLQSEQAVDWALIEQGEGARTLWALEVYALQLAEAEQRTRDQQLGMAVPDVMDEVLLLFGRNLDRLSLGELESRGVAEFGAVADRRVQARVDWVVKEQLKDASGVVAGLKRLEQRLEQPDDKKATGSALKKERNRVSGLTGRAEDRGGATRAGAATGAPVRVPVPSAAPPAPGATDLAKGAVSFAGGSLTPALVVRPESRLFFALLGPDALKRTRAVLESVPGVQELPARRAFEANGKQARAGVEPGEAGEKAGKTKRSPPTKEDSGATKPDAMPGYKIFQVTLPMAESDGLIGRLESQPGLVLRSLGRSYLSGLSGETGPPRSRAGRTVQEPKGGGAPPMRRIVLVVFER